MNTRQRLAAALLALGALPALAGSQDAALEEVLQRSRAIVRDAQAENPQNPLTRAAKATANAPAATPQRGDRRLAPKADPSPTLIADPKGAVIHVLVTGSLVEGSLDQIMTELGVFQSRYPGVATRAYVSIRGLMPGDRQIGQTLRRLAPYVAKARAATAPGQTMEIEVNLNPKSFRDFHVGDSAPALCILYPNGQVARAHGTLSPVAVHERYLKGQLDQGVLGPTVAIAERSLLDEIRDRVNRLDTAKMQKGAQDRLWDRLSRPAVDLPAAASLQRREIDVAFRLQQDITGAQDQVLFRNGTRFNPLDQMPFHRFIIVFNPARPGEIELVDRIIAASGYPRSEIRLIATHFALPGAAGAKDAMGTLIKRFGRQVYLVDPVIVERFNITSTPTSINADNTRRLMILTEYPQGYRGG